MLLVSSCISTTKYTTIYVRKQYLTKGQMSIYL